MTITTHTRRADHEAAPTQPMRGSRGSLASLSLALLLSSLGTSIANVGLPALGQAFAAPFQAVQWVVIAYLLAMTALIVSAGRLGDLIGRRRLLMAGIALFTAASALCGMAPALPVLIGARALQGLGAAVMMALAVAMVGEAVPKAQIGRAMGLLGTMSAVGTALGPSLGGALIALTGWRAIFLVNVPLGLLSLLLVRHFLRDGEEAAAGAPRLPFDMRGTLLLAATLTAYALAMTTGRGGFGAVQAALMLAAAGGAGLFLAVEVRVASPLVRPAMLRDGMLGPSLAVNLCVATVMMTTLVVGPFYLSRALGLDAAMTGAVMSVGPLISTVSGVLAGRAVDRLGAANMVIAGLAAMAAGAAMLSGLAGLGGYVAGIAVLTPGYQLFQAANNTMVMADVTSAERGVVSGMLGLSRNLGLITGASVMGAIFAAALMGADPATADAAAVSAAMRITFMAAAGLIVAGLAIAVVARGRARGGGRA
jgi:MFS family permease